MDTQHRLEDIGTPAFAGLGIHRLDHRQQSLTRDQLLHFGQEFLRSRLLAFARILGVREVQLRHDRHAEFGRLIATCSSGLVHSFLGKYLLHFTDEGAQMSSKLRANRTPSTMVALRIVTALYCGTISSISLAAGFDCRKATSDVEKIICDDGTLSTLDSQLQETYLLTLADASVSQKSEIKQSQEEWIANTRNQCIDRGCLQAAYFSQLNILASIKTATVSAHYVISGSEAKSLIAGYQQQLNRDGFPGYLGECRRVIRLDDNAPPEEPKLNAGKDTSYGAICSFNNRLVMICDDTMIGKMTLKLTGFTVNGPALASFTQMNCPAGG